MLFLEQRDSSSKWANAVRTVVGVSSRMRDRCAAQSITPQPHHPSRAAHWALVHPPSNQPRRPSASASSRRQLQPVWFISRQKAQPPPPPTLSHPDRCRHRSRPTSASRISLWLPPRSLCLATPKGLRSCRREEALAEASATSPHPPTSIRPRPPQNHHQRDSLI
jgi:hypothetical protein